MTSVAKQTRRWPSVWMRGGGCIVCNFRRLTNSTTDPPSSKVFVSLTAPIHEVIILGWDSPSSSCAWAVTSGGCFCTDAASTSDTAEGFSLPALAFVAFLTRYLGVTRYMACAISLTVTLDRSSSSPKGVSTGKLKILLTSKRGRLDIALIGSVNFGAFGCTNS